MESSCATSSIKPPFKDGGGRPIHIFTDRICLSPEENVFDRAEKSWG